jgi:hypothetical protein
MFDTDARNESKVNRWREINRNGIEKRHQIDGNNSIKRGTHGRGSCFPVWRLFRHIKLPTRAWFFPATSRAPVRLDVKLTRLTQSGERPKGRAPHPYLARLLAATCGGGGVQRPARYSCQRPELWTNNINGNAMELDNWTLSLHTMWASILPIFIIIWKYITLTHDMVHVPYLVESPNVLTQFPVVFLFRRHGNIICVNS